MTARNFHDTPLAIVGMACRVPGADDLQEFWRLIESGGNAVIELPPERFDQSLYYNPEKGVLGKSYTKIGGMVPDRPFDRAVCPVSDELLANADPMHLTFLEVAARACLDAGYDPLNLPTRNTGVYVGHARGSLLAGDLIYSTHVEEIARLIRSEVDALRALPDSLADTILQDLVRDVRATKAHLLPGGGPFVGANEVGGLVAEALGLHGPYMAVDVACASSLYALALAAQALHHGRIDMAIVGGASYSSWQSLVMFSNAQALSAHGSFPFDARADGFVSSDGYGALLVKTLDRAIADGNKIYGVVRGVGISNDGHGRSLWAPRKDGQIPAIHRAYRHGYDPGRLQYIEAHGTSTQLGDATELEAITEAFSPYLPAGARVPVSSVKGNIGHTRETAGVSGLIKTLLVMKNGVIPAAPNFKTPNPQIPWDEIPFFVPTSAMEWTPHRDGLRCAAVDAFGIGGVNAHVVLESAPTMEPMAFRMLVPSVNSNGVQHDEPNRDADAIAVIGMGAVFPGARTIEAYRTLISEGRSAIGPVPAERWDEDIYWDPEAAGPWRTPARQGGFVTDFAYDWARHKIPPKQVEGGDPLQFMLLDAADQALHDSGYDRKPFARERAGVVIGTIFGGDFNAHLSLVVRMPELQRDLRQTLEKHGIPEDQRERIVEQYREAMFRAKPMLFDETASYSSSTLASRVSKTLDLLGGAMAIDAGAASSFASLETAVGLLRNGTYDLVFCAGGQRSMDIVQYEMLSLRGILGRDGSGSLPGEGVGMLLLKRLGDARRDGDQIKAVIRGIGAHTDTAAPAQAIGAAVERALDEARVQPAEIVALESIGLEGPGFESGEAEAIAATYGAGQHDDSLIADSVVPQIGFSFGASGMASLLKLALSLPTQRAVAPVGAAAATAARHDGQGHGSIHSNGRAMRQNERPDRRLGGVSSLSFRGLAYHVLLEDAEQTVEVNVQQTESDEWRIARLGAADLAELIERVIANQDRAESLFASAGMSRFASRDRARLAIVAQNAESLDKKLKLAAQQLAQPSARAVLEEQGIFYRTLSAAPPRLAAMFPGQGSQYIGMLRDLTREIPGVHAKLNEIDETMARLGYPTFAEIAWDENSPLGSDVWKTQVSVLLSNTLVYEALKTLGVRPDVVSGHSYGEYAAMVAAGAWSLEQAIIATRARSSLIENNERVLGMMTSTTAAPEVIERLREGIPGIVVVANHNAPDQTVIGGEPAPVVELEERLVAAGYENRRLPVPRPFHTPVMAVVQAPFRDAIQSIRLTPPVIPVLSSVTNRYVADPLDIRDNLVRQLTDPVHYVDLIRRLERDGVTAFVEVGPRQVLSRLNRRILPDSDAIIIPADNPKRPGRAQLLHVQAALEVAGFAVGQSEQQESTRAAVVNIPAAKPHVVGSIVHFDATAKRREKMRHVASAPVDVPQSPFELPAAAPVAGETDELSAFLINFVCEQTGYPPEVVDLDADMEADLGIDSIKKAQLFGELREEFDLKIESAEQLALDNFPTLRHILQFLRDQGVQTGSRTADAPVSVADVAPAGPAPATVEAPETGPTVADLNLIRLEGTPFEMGQQVARAQGEEIRGALRAYREFMDRVQTNFQAELPGLLDMALSEAPNYLDEAALEEIRGMAEVLEIPVANLTAFNLALNLDYAPGCAQFAIAGQRNGSTGLLHASNEDWPLALKLPGSLVRTVQVRFPTDAIPYILFSAAGEAGGINGINAHGVAVTSTSLLDREWGDGQQHGLAHSITVRTVLERAKDIDSAIEIIRGLQRTGAWSICLSHHPSDRVAYLEYDAQSFTVETDRELVVTANHCQLLGPIIDIPEHSRHRFNRLQALLDNAGETGISLEQAQRALRDRFDLARHRETPFPTLNTVQRVDNQVSIVMLPAEGALWVTPGPLAKDKSDRYVKLDINALLELETVATAPAAPSTAPIPATLFEGEQEDPAELDVPADLPGRVMNRFVLRMIDAPLPPGTPSVPRFRGPALILGDNPTSDVLQSRLEEHGATVYRLPLLDDHQATLAELDRLWQDRPLLNLFLLTSREDEAASGLDPAVWGRRRERGIMAPYLVCQRWTHLLSEAGLIDQAALVAVTGLGGDFGLSGHGAAVEGGGLAGLMKAIRREFKMRTKVIDTPFEEAPGSVVGLVLTELAAGTPEIEVGYFRGQRRLMRVTPRPAVARADQQITSGETWVVTGGGRGVTAYVARELGHRYGLNLQLIGLSPAEDVDEAWLEATDLHEIRATVTREAHQAGHSPAAAWNKVQRSIEIARTLRQFEAEGVNATYHACDVADRAALSAVLDRIRATSGPIRGVIHGAGTESAARYDRKNPERVKATISSKVDGAVNVMALTQNDPVKYFVAFGSVSGRYGGLGQTDYSLASDLLCKMVHRYRSQRTDCDAVVINWPAWGEIGMAMRPESRLSLETGGQRFMPPLEGAEHLIGELLAGAPEGEVVIVDRPGRLDMDRTMPLAAERLAYQRRHARIAELPLVEGIIELTDDQRLVAEYTFDPTTDPFLTDHRIQGNPVLPGVLGVESLAEAAATLSPEHVVVGLRDVEIQNGLRFYTDRAQRVAVEAVATTSGAECALHGGFFNRQGRLVDPNRVYVKGGVELGATRPELTFPKLERPAEWHEMSYTDAAEAENEGRVYHGPPMRRLKRVSIERDGGWGEIVAPAPAELGGSRPGGWIIPASVLDACLVSCGVYARKVLELSHLPHGFEAIHLGSRLPRDGETCIVRFHYRGQRDGGVYFDLLLYGDDDTAILSVEGYRGVLVPKV